ncbi:MAG TPA: prepilin peptidase [Terracidiphilus sp.]|nr:prepilin peptidase [Terracidiphilus sp.]
MIRILSTLFAGLAGLAFGSFLNVCLTRWPEGESIVKPRSHCRNCNRSLAWWENIPLVSWIFLRGRCRTCKASISLRYPLIELAVGVLWAVAAWQMLGDTFENFVLLGAPVIGVLLIAGRCIEFWLLVALAALDAEHLWLPNKLTLPGIALGLLVNLAQLELAAHWFDPGKDPWIGIAYLVLGVIAAAGIILLIRWVYWLIRRQEGIGLGDAKLMALLAAWLGFPGALLAFVIGIVLGSVVSLVALGVPAARRGSESWAMTRLPLGTFLCIGGIVSTLWGQQIIAAYLHYEGFH